MKLFGGRGLWIDISGFSRWSQGFPTFGFHSHYHHPPPPNNSIYTCICTSVPRSHIFPSELTLDYYTLSQRKLLYCTFQKHANSEAQKLTDVCVLLSIILEDLLGNRSLLQRVQKVMVCDWWILIHRVCSCVSRFIACDRNDWRQQKTQLWRQLLNFRVRMFLKSAVKPVQFNTIKRLKWWHLKH